MAHDERKNDDSNAEPTAVSRGLPWVGWLDSEGSHLTTWVGETREVVLVGAKTPVGTLPPGAEAYEVPEGRDARDLARELGGIVVLVFANAPQYRAAP